MQQLITDNPSSNLESIFNFAYVKNREVWLRGAFDGKDIELCEYIAELSRQKKVMCENMNSEDVCESCGAGDCFCGAGALFIAATQAAELRARLKGFASTKPPSMKTAEWEEIEVLAQHLCRDGSYKKVRRKKYRCTNCGCQTIIQSVFCPACGCNMAAQPERWDPGDG